MEKRIRKADYYKGLIEKMGTSPLTELEVKTLIENLEKETFDEKPSSTVIDAIFRKLIYMIKSHVEVVKIEAKISRGQRHPKMYCIADKTTLGARRSVDTFFREKPEMKVRHRKSNINLGRKAIERVENILHAIGSRPDKTGTLETIAKACNLPRVQRSEVESWLETVGKNGVKINYEFERLDYGRKGSHGLVILPSPDTYFDSMRKLAEKAGISRKVETTKVIKPAVIPEKEHKSVLTDPLRPIWESQLAKEKEAQTETPEQNVQRTEYDEVIFIIGSLLHAEKRCITMMDMAATLRNKFSVKDATVGTIISKLKDVNEITQQGATIHMTSTTEESWKAFVEKYGPSSFISRTIYARIGMSLEEVKKYFPNAVIFNAISERDNIYSIKLSYSHHDWNKLIQLYRTFRGSDAIIDSELQKELCIEVQKIDGKVNSNDPIYQLEAERYN